MTLHDDKAGRGTSLESVLAELKRGKAVPCYLLYGDEDFRIKEAVEKIIASLIPDPRDRELNLFVTDGERENVGSLCESLTTLPLLPGAKVLVVRNTLLFQSKNVIMPLVERIRERLESDPTKAAADFMQFLSLAGLQLEDLREDGWRKISDDTWQKILPEDSKVLETWLPSAIDLCVSKGLVQRAKSDDTDRLEQVLSGKMPESNYLILTAETVDQRKKLFKVVSTVGKAISFTKITGKGWAKDKARKEAVEQAASNLLTKSGKKISDDAWTSIGQKTDFDLRESMLAIEKLITYVDGKKIIDKVDVDAVIGRTKEESIFDLTNAIAERKLLAALKSLQELLYQGDPPLKIFSMITREIRILLRAKLLIASGRLSSFKPGMAYPQYQKTVYPILTKLFGEVGMEGISPIPKTPYPSYLVLTNAGRFSQPELISYLEMLSQIDLALKSTGKDARLLLERFLLAVCKE